MKQLRISTFQPCILLIAIVLAFLPLACTPSQSDIQSQAQLSSGTLPTLLPTIVATPADKPLPPPSSPLIPLPTTQDKEWLEFTNRHGISFQYPKNWDILYNEPPIDTAEFVFSVSPPNAYHWTQIIARFIPKIEEPTLYHYAGEIFSAPQFGDNKFVWDKQITSSNQVDWHLTMHGYSLFTGRCDGLEYIAQTGGLTEGTIEAIHHDATRELAIFVSLALDRDMLITLHESGPDAVYPAMVPVFEEILQSVTIQAE